MEDMREYVENLVAKLSTEEREMLNNRVNTFLGYKQQIKDLQESMKEQVQAAKSELKGSLSKKETGSIFSFFRKNKTPAELRLEADTLEALKEVFGK